MLMICPKCSGSPAIPRQFSGASKDVATGEWIVKCQSCGNGLVVSESTGKPASAAAAPPPLGSQQNPGHFDNPNRDQSPAKAK